MTQAGPTAMDCLSSHRDRAGSGHVTPTSSVEAKPMATDPCQEWTAQQKDIDDAILLLSTRDSCRQGLTRKWTAQLDEPREWVFCESRTQP